MSEPTGDNDQGKILAKVRGLLAKAESSEFPEEADAFQRKAFALMSTYGIEQAMLAASGVKADEVDKITISVSGGYAGRLAVLIHVIARALDAKAVYSKKHPGSPRHGIPAREGYVTVIGYRSTLERVEFLYTLLLAQATRGMGRVSGSTAGESRSLRAGYLTGFASEVGQRLEMAERVARREYEQEHSGDGSGDGSGAALVLADRKSMVLRRFDAMFPNTRTRRAGRVNSDGYDAGRRDGRTADLGGKRFGSARARAIGA